MDQQAVARPPKVGHALHAPELHALQMSTSTSGSACIASPQSHLQRPEVVLCRVTAPLCPFWRSQSRASYFMSPGKPCPLILFQEAAHRFRL